MSSRRLSSLAPLNSGLCAAVVVAYLFSTAALLASQSRQARLTGSVADANGAAWPGAVVRVRNRRSKRIVEGVVRADGIVDVPM